LEKEITMKASASAILLMLGIAMPFVAQASELKPLEAGTFVLGDHTMSVYYTANGNTFEVVATIAPSDASGAPLRVVGFLRPGQKQLVSAGAFGTNGLPETLELVHQGDLLSAERVTNVAVAN
jgi:hypothetical protein